MFLTAYIYNVNFYFTAVFGSGIASVNTTRRKGYLPLTLFQIPSQVIKFKCGSPSLEVKTVVASALRSNNLTDRTWNAKVSPLSLTIYTLSPGTSLFKS